MYKGVWGYAVPCRVEGCAEKKTEATVLFKEAATL